jgi:U3 small nucleolar RNA-associated protein 6
MSPGAARTLLQRGLRLNKDDEPLWTEYVKFELGFIESLRKRWQVLGVSGDTEEESKEAREEILSGAIVRTVMTEAVKGEFEMGYGMRV